MSQVTKSIRVILLTCVFAIAAWFVQSPGMGFSQEIPEDDQDAWDECLFGGHPDVGTCLPNREHIWEGECQGVDCYAELEHCCQM